MPAEKILNPGPVHSPLIVDEDAVCVARTRAGELDAFEELVRRHQKQIYRTLVAITRSPDDAEDGLQNVFLKAFQNIGDFHGASKL
jgi:RNA polymerase sigma-70 factor (ECF subfamily)